MSDETKPGVLAYDSIPVSLKMCDKRSEKLAEKIDRKFDKKTDAIAHLLAEKTKVLDRTTRDLQVITARQNGKRSLKEDIWKTGRFWLSVIGTLVVLGGLVWGAAKMAQPAPHETIDYDRLAKTVVTAMKESP